MKAPAYFKTKLFAIIAAISILLAVAAYLLIVPHVLPAIDPLAAEVSAWRVGILLAVFSFVASGIVALVLLALVKPERSLQDIGDALRQPFLLLDESNRYLIINREAERVLGLNRERDFGKPADRRIAEILGKSTVEPSTLSLAAILSQNENYYQIIDNPLPSTDGHGRQHIIILREINSLIRLKDAVKEINTTMAVLNANTMKISNSAVSLSQGATEQATSLTSITASMDEFSKKIQGNTESAAKSTQLAAQAREAAERSGGELANALSAMTDVQDAGIRIARIVKLIDDIAFQTNLLALNAAVEAARAGRQGKGFAVVADEVRNLAGRSAKAAKDTASMVEDVTERIGNASAYISRLEEMLRNIVQDAIRMADSSASASTTSAEQASGILRVNQELGQMNSVTQSTMSAAEQTATAVEVLAHQVKTLKTRIDELAEDFALDGVETKAWSGGSINLLDDPADVSESIPAARSYLTDSYDGLFDETENAETPGAQDALSAEDPWNLKADFDFRKNRETGVYDNGRGKPDQRDFWEPGNKDAERANALLGQKGPGPELETREGDRVIRPTQTIHLDDAEFGRY